MGLWLSKQSWDLSWLPTFLTCTIVNHARPTVVAVQADEVFEDEFGDGESKITCFCSFWEISGQALESVKDTYATVAQGKHQLSGEDSWAGYEL